jgi:uncharacterized protein DUF559
VEGTSEVLTTAQARANGVSTRRLGKGAEFVRLHRGVYVKAQPDLALATRAAAALSVSKAGAYVSFHTAAALLGYCVPPEAPIHVSVPRGSRRQPVPGIVRHQAPREAQIRMVRGLPVSAPGQCVRDLVSVLPLVDAVTLVDSLCARERSDLSELRSQLGSQVGPRLSETLSLANPLSESPTESRLRVLLVLGGLPTPSTQHVVRDPGTGRRYRLDLAYPEWLVAVEYDGRQHALDSQQYAGDVERRNALQRMGWIVITVVAKTLYNSPGQVLSEVASAIEARTGRAPAIDPRWRGHFVQR